MVNPIRQFLGINFRDVGYDMGLWQDNGQEGSIPQHGPTQVQIQNVLGRVRKSHHSCTWWSFKTKPSWHHLFKMRNNHTSVGHAIKKLRFLFLYATQSINSFISFKILCFLIRVWSCIEGELPNASAILPTWFRVTGSDPFPKLHWERREHRQPIFGSVLWNVIQHTLMLGEECCPFCAKLA